MSALRRRWRWRWALVLPAAAGLAALPVWGSSFGRLADLAERVSRDAGVVIAEVWVSGRGQAGWDSLERALSPAVGENALFLDLDALAAAVEGAGWVERAEIRVLLPDRLHVVLTERVPAAVWQSDGSFYVIEASGAVLAPVGRGAFPHLPMVVGDGANTTLEDLTRILAPHPAFAARLHASVRVAHRRWTLQTHTGALIHLPEDEPAAALARLADASGGLEALDLDIEVVDLRVPGRIAVRLRDSARPFAPAEGV